jgi:hypothetical protein
MFEPVLEEVVQPEVKNTFINFPGRLFAPASSKKRASSCPAKSPRRKEDNDFAEMPQVDYSMAEVVEHSHEVDFMAMLNDHRGKKEVSPGSANFDMLSCSTTFDSLDGQMDNSMCQSADYDCAHSIDWSWRDPASPSQLDSGIVVEKGAYITGDGDHYYSNHIKGVRDLKWKRSCLVLRGLPFSATECDVADFLEQCGVLGNLAPGRPITLLVTPQGRPSGLAEVNLVGEVEAEESRTLVHMQHLGGRYIEVLPPGKWANGGGSGGGVGSFRGDGTPSASSSRSSRGGRNAYEDTSRRGGYGFNKHTRYERASMNENWR